MASRTWKVRSRSFSSSASSSGMSISSNNPVIFAACRGSIALILVNNFSPMSCFSWSLTVIRAAASASRAACRCFLSWFALIGISWTACCLGKTATGVAAILAAIMRSPPAAMGPSIDSGACSAGAAAAAPPGADLAFSRSLLRLAARSTTAMACRVTAPASMLTKDLTELPERPCCSPVDSGAFAARRLLRILARCLNRCELKFSFSCGPSSFGSTASSSTKSSSRSSSAGAGV